MPDAASVQEMPVELLREIGRSGGPLTTAEADAVLRLADSLSALTPERVEALRQTAEVVHCFSCEVAFDGPSPPPFNECGFPSCAQSRAALTALAALAGSTNGRAE